MTRVPLFLLSFVIAMYVPGLLAKAQSSITCGEHNTVLEALQRKQVEERVAVGVINDGAVLELLATSSGSRWIALVTTTSGKSCLVAFGSDLSARAIPVVIAETPSVVPETWVPGGCDEGSVTGVCGQSGQPTTMLRH